MHNVEFKAELRDFHLAESICRALGAAEVGILEQTDTYYRVGAGRLKKREQPGEPPEFIYYDRPDRLIPKLSHFRIYSANEARERFGDSPLPHWLTVRKHRSLFLLGNVRIHLDRVDQLGTFLEFEAMVSPSCNVSRCHKAIAELRVRFGPALGEAISCGYSDLLAREVEAADAHQP